MPDTDVDAVVLTEDEVAYIVRFQDEVSKLPEAKDGAVAFFPLVWSGDWKNLTVEAQIIFRDRFEKMVGSVGKLRGKFDEAVWEGHDDGSVDPSVTSIRARRTGDPGGAKPKVKSMEEILGLD